MTGNDKDKPRMPDPRPDEERRSAEPDAASLRDPKEVWKDGETAPSPRRSERSGMLGRVADAGDIGEGQPGPYEAEVAADAVSTGKPNDDVERPARVVWDERRQGRNKPGTTSRK